MDSISSMSLSENDRKWLKYATRVAEEIKAAWRHQPLPKHGIEIFLCTHGDECKECADYTSFFEANTPDRLILQPQPLCNKLVSLKCFSPEYFVYYLPAFMLATLAAPHTLAPIAKTVNLYAFSTDNITTERLRVLTVCQIEAVNHYLELYRALEAENLSEAAASSSSS